MKLATKNLDIFSNLKLKGNCLTCKLGVNFRLDRHYPHSWFWNHDAKGNFDRQFKVFY